MMERENKAKATPEKHLSSQEKKERFADAAYSYELFMKTGITLPDRKVRGRRLSRDHFRRTGYWIPGL